MLENYWIEKIAVCVITDVLKISTNKCDVKNKKVF
ncbi:unnamed protein product [Paramecium pentaurelia]|uniref:Uncharacterized protein n=1 Tax=Paramecium pentaurelia TaxID=43138 RepID=A0A8S1XQ63_9CILI|nr:unnamed protein product [Paramecium pentaurelia]